MEKKLILSKLAKKRNELVKEGDYELVTRFDTLMRWHMLSLNFYDENDNDFACLCEDLGCYVQWHADDDYETIVITIPCDKD